MSKKISIIVSVYNEEEVLFEFYRETIKVLLLIENPEAHLHPRGHL